MLILGLLILLLAVLFIAYVFLGADGSATLDAFNISTTLPLSTLFLAGMLSLLAVGLGLWLMTAGTRRAAKKRKEHKALERDAREARIQREQTAAVPVDRDVRDRDLAGRERSVAGESPRYEEYQEERTLRPGEPLQRDSRLDQDPYPRG